MAKGGRYELQVEAPGVENDTMDIKVSRDTIEISSERSEKSSEKTKDFIYNERSHASFYRKIQVPEDFEPSNV